MDSKIKVIYFLCIFHLVIARKESRTRNNNYDYNNYDDEYYEKLHKQRALSGKLILVGEKIKEPSHHGEEQHIPEESYDQNQHGQPAEGLNYEDNQQAEEQENLELQDKNDCWMTLNSNEFFKVMQKMESESYKVRRDFQRSVGYNLAQHIIDSLLQTRGAAHRATYKVGGDSLHVPAGINLGGFCMVRLADSILFFHRMKLRNSTHFELLQLDTDMMTMILSMQLNLNDLHLTGAYERSPTHAEGPSTLYYRPSFGNIELLLKNVEYEMEGKLRMLEDRITLELIYSELTVKDDILLSYLNTNLTDIPEYTVSIESRNMDDYFLRLKMDLDLWLKDYINDILMYYQPPDFDSKQFQEFEKKKTIYLNEYAHYAVNAIRQKTYNLGGNEIFLPTFTLFGVPSTILRISDGTLRGMETMHIRSVATGEKISNNLRKLDFVIGFSRLRAEYKFEAVIPNGSPPLTGHLVLTGDELTALLTIILMQKPVTTNLHFDLLQQLRPEYLTIEGPANRIIANYKHMIENQIIAIISNAIIHNIKMLNTITRCNPFLYGNVENYRNENTPLDDNEEDYVREPIKKDVLKK